jgi:hypothetical protein
VNPILDPNEQEAVATSKNIRDVAPEGNYLCRISEVSKYTTGKSLVWKYKVGEGEWTGKEFWEFTGLGDDGMWRTKARFASIDKPLSADASEIEGMVVRVSVEIGANQRGEPKNNVVGVVPVLADLPPEPEPAAFDQDIKDVFGG